MSRDRGHLSADRHEVVCPYCGEAIDIYIEPDVRGVLVQDCEVCCKPWLLHVHGRGDDRWLSIARADGTD